MSARRTRRGIILLTLLAFLSWQLSRSSGDPEDGPISGLDTRLNYALFDFEALLLDEQGRTNLEIDAPSLRSDAASGIGTVQQPNIRIQQEDEEWYITADSAVITADREHITLHGDVKLLRRNQVTGDLLDIKTSEVLLNVTPRTASTESEVRIRHAGDSLDATGMKIDMIEDRYELLSDVRAHYDVL